MTLLSSLKSSIASFRDREEGFVVVGTTAPTQSVTIALVKAQGIAAAPYQIHLEANISGFGIEAGSGDYNPQHHELEYIWSIEKVGDSGWASSEYSLLTNGVSQHKAKGTRYGKRIGHVFGIEDVAAGSPSTFRFICTAINLATGASATSGAYDVVIEHPDDVFSAAETVVVRSDAGESVPAGLTSNTIQTTLDGARNFASGLGGSKVRILLQRGRTFTDGFINMYSGTQTAWALGTWGASPTRTTITGTFQIGRGDTGANINSVQVYGVRMDTGANRAFQLAERTGGPETVYTVSDIKIADLTNSLMTFESGDDDKSVFAFHSIDFINTTNTFYFDGKRHKSFLWIGCRLGFDHVALNGHHPFGGGWGIRGHFASDYCAFVQNDFCAGRGWFQLFAGPSETGSMFRAFTGNIVPGVFSHWDRNAVEAGAGLISVGPEAANTETMNLLIERNMLIGGHDTVRFLRIAAGGVTIRNNIFVKPPSRNAQNVSDYELKRFMEFLAAGTPTGDDPRDQPVLVYNNTFVSLSKDANPTIIDAGPYTVTDANNVTHLPFAPTPVNAGTFTLSDQFSPRFPGYSDRREGGDPLYVVGFATNSTPFTAGETVTGGTSGFAKTFVETQPIYNGLTGLAFSATAINGPLGAGGIDRFTPGETLTGNLGGSAVLRTTGYINQQDPDLMIDGINLIPNSATPTHFILYDAETGAFTEGETLTGAGGATALICQVWDDGTTGRLWLRNVSGTFVDNETITDGATGSATANGTAQSAGTGALWTLTTSTARDAGTWATDPFTRRNILGAETTLRGALAS